MFGGKKKKLKTASALKTGVTLKQIIIVSTLVALFITGLQFLAAANDNKVPPLWCMLNNCKDPKCREAYQCCPTRSCDKNNYSACQSNCVRKSLCCVQTQTQAQPEPEPQPTYGAVPQANSPACANGVRGITNNNVGDNPVVFTATVRAINKYEISAASIPTGCDKSNIQVLRMDPTTAGAPCLHREGNGCGLLATPKNVATRRQDNNLYAQFCDDKSLYDDNYGEYKVTYQCQRVASAAVIPPVTTVCNNDGYCNNFNENAANCPNDCKPTTAAAVVAACTNENRQKWIDKIGQEASSGAYTAKTDVAEKNLKTCECPVDRSFFTLERQGVYVPLGANPVNFGPILGSVFYRESNSNGWTNIVKNKDFFRPPQLSGTYDFLNKSEILLARMIKKFNSECRPFPKGCYISSSYRNPEDRAFPQYNTPTNAHRNGIAMDIACNGVNQTSILSLLQQNIIAHYSSLGFRVIDEGAIRHHIHIDLKK